LRKLENAPMSDIIHALAKGQVTATALTKGYLARIEAFDRDGPVLNSVRELNPDALTIAGRLDDAKPSVSRPLAGIPMLLKDNIATGDKQPTTAGSLALEDARAKDDATIVKLLREAGAVILGKANLTEFANMLAIDMPPGYSSLGGQVKSPYAPTLIDDHGIPVVSPGGSSSGSAVAVAAGLCAASIGTETSGSLLNPASQNGLVTVKPTVGLISRAGILPISHSQDTAGPMTRTVRRCSLRLHHPDAHYSSFNPFALTTLPKRSLSAWISATISSGLVANGSPEPAAASFSANSPCWTTAFTAARSRAMTEGGVAAGTNKPCHIVTS
jgi:amidase